MNATTNVVYRETKPDLGNMRNIIVEQALQLLKIRLEILKKDKSFDQLTRMISEFISGFEDSCSSATVGVVYNVADDNNDEEFTNWAFKELFDRELYLFSGTWDLRYRGETSLSGFLQDFRLNRRDAVIH